MLPFYGKVGAIVALLLPAPVILFDRPAGSVFAGKNVSCNGTPQPLQVLL